MELASQVGTPAITTLCLPVVVALMTPHLAVSILTHPSLGSVVTRLVASMAPPASRTLVLVVCLNILVGVAWLQTAYLFKVRNLL